MDCNWTGGYPWVCSDESGLRFTCHGCDGLTFCPQHFIEHVQEIHPEQVEITSRN